MFRCIAFSHKLENAASRDLKRFYPYAICLSICSHQSVRLHRWCAIVRVLPELGHRSIQLPRDASKFSFPPVERVAMARRNPLELYVADSICAILHVHLCKLYSMSRNTLARLDGHSVRYAKCECG